MFEAERLLEIIKSMIQQYKPTTTDLVVGTVVSVSPIAVMVDNVVIPREFLFVGFACKETWIPKKYIDEPPHTHEYHHGTTSAEISQIQQIMLWRGLRVGDKVIMLKCAEGQKYYILQREEGCIDDIYIRPDE